MREKETVAWLYPGAEFDRSMRVALARFERAHPPSARGDKPDHLRSPIRAHQAGRAETKF